jgi:lipid-binding SYLF domain-containing protein
MKSTIGMILVLTVVAGLLVGCATAPTSRADRDALLAEATSSLQQMRAEDSALGELARRSYGYALFPKVTKGGLGVGGAYGRGVVYERGRHVGYSDLSQASVGLQAVGQTFGELLVFESKDALDQLKAGQFNFAADASAVVMESGMATNVTFADGVAVVVRPMGGAMVEAAIGGQKFAYETL